MQTPLNERLRKRKAFADQGLMDSTVATSFLGYSLPNVQLKSHLPTIPSISQNLFGFGFFGGTSLCDIKNEYQVKMIESVATKPKISFSIESIMGTK